MNINTMLTLASLVIFGVVVALLYLKSKNQTVKIEIQSFNSLEKVIEAVKNEMVEIVREDFTLGLSDEEFDRLYKRKARVNEALKNCVFGIDSAKILVIDLIRGFIVSKVPTTIVTSLLGLDEEGEPSDHLKFEILMYKYKKVYNKDALVKWIDKNEFNEEKRATDASGAHDQAYFISVEELNKSYAEENIVLDIEEQIDLLAIVVYQHYKGFGIIDTLREMNINGFNMGTSGSILAATSNQKFGEFKANNAVWLYDRGKYIHLRFLNYGSEEELRRIIQLLIRWGNPGPLTSKRGYLVNTMSDKSRILALRPPASEYWAVFVRKFTLSDVSPEALILKEYTNRGDLCIRLIEFLIRGQITCGVTGRQGSGKTTLMSSIIRYVDPRYNIRVLEIAPELYLREIYPTRNILSLQETSHVSLVDLQDALKKADGAVSIVGEVASAVIAARMIEMGLVASLFTLFSHHANTAKDLVLALRNNLSSAGGFSNSQIAEKQVLDVVKCDIHLDYTADGKRYIERISEIVPLEEGIPYPDIDTTDPNSMNVIIREFYQRSTDRVGFYTHDILRYNLLTHTYYAHERITATIENRMRLNLGKARAAEFDLFMLKEWGAEVESTLTPEELEAKIAELEISVKCNNDEKNEEYNKNTALSMNELTAEQIEAAAADKEIWAAGYEDGTPENKQDKQAGEFELGLFFDDSDYN